MLEDIISQWGGAEVSAMDVYGDMFSLGEGLIQRSGEPAGRYKANPVGYFKGKSDSRGQYRILFDDTFESVLSELQQADFAIVNGIAYFGRKNLQAHASKMYAMIFDLDGVTEDSLNAFFSGAVVGGAYPVPNYVALSGHGVHLYYLFEQAIPLYPNIKLQLKELKYALTDKMWNQYTSTIKKKQFQGINQGFRPIGGKTKIEGVKVRAFRVNQHPFDVEQLNQYIPKASWIDSSKLYRESKLTLEQARKKYPAWYQDKVIDKKPQKYWECKYDLYLWWFVRISTEATYGHRYFCIMCLAIYGVKCGVPFEQVQQDSLNLIPLFTSINPKEPFTENDVMSALECYDKKYCTFPIKDIEKISGISIKRNRRNHRKQAVHLKIMRSTLEIMNDEAGKSLQGRKSKKNIVRAWRVSHPESTPTQAARELNISRTTVYKYWSIETTEETTEKNQ